jgi:transcriptional regulator with XRE-family HTH domain
MTAKVAHIAEAESEFFLPCPQSQIFGKRLSIVMIREGINGKRLALDSGFDQATISRWQAGKQMPARKSVLILAGVLGCSADYLIGEADADPEFVQKSVVGKAELFKVILHDYLHEFMEVAASEGFEIAVKCSTTTRRTADNNQYRRKGYAEE